jgi:RNA polymerase sigma-70 factor (ECF subfamily)
VFVSAMSESDLEVTACVRRVRLGDEEAAQALVQHLYPKVLRLVRAHLPRRTGEEDLTQTVFMKVFAKLDQYSGQVPLEHWVSRITINTCLNALAAEKVRPELRRADLSDEQQALLEKFQAGREEAGPADCLAARELVEQLLTILSPRDRLLITLLHLDGHTPREVQKITGWNGTLIRGRAFQARRRLRKHFDRIMKQPV